MCSNVFRMIIIATVAISADFKQTVDNNNIYEKEYLGICANEMTIYKKCNSGRCPYAHVCEYNYCCPILTVQSSTSAPKLTSTTAKLSTTSWNFAQLATDCYDWRLNGSTSDGIYRINPGYKLAPFDVYCDMTTDGGGWTVIQRRVDASLEFWNNTWQQYKDGFNNGIESGNLWLGNDRIHVMSSRWNVTLRVEINGDRNHNNPNLYVYGTHNFSISDETTNYTLYISLPIEGNASNADPSRGFHYNNGMPFSTVDKSSNQYGSHCANTFQFGAWWFNNPCIGVALNGKYNPTVKYYGFQWYSQATDIILSIRSEIKIRRI